VNNMRMYALSCGAVRTDKGNFTLGRDKGLKIDVPVPSFLIVHPKGAVLFDTGCHPDVAHDPLGRWGGLAKAMFPVCREGDDVVGQLARIGFRPDDVAVVINSHLHMDHCGGNQFFPKAVFYVQQDELDAARDPAMEGQGYFRHDWDHPLDYRAVAGDHDVFGDRAVEIILTPGHTAGHQSLVVRLPQSGAIVIASDACYMVENYDELLLPRMTANPDDSMRSYLRLHAIQESERAFVVVGHDPEFWQSHVKHPPAYYE